jgi:hypothetical protein
MGKSQGIYCVIVPACRKVAQGIEVIHLLNSQRTFVHELSRFATINNGIVIYNRIAPQQLELQQND